jgi:hypothetical protein
VQLGELLLDEAVVFITDRRVPIEFAFIVRIENAVVKTGLQSILFASGHK